MKLGPVDSFWHARSSLMHSSVVMWSSVDSSRTPHLMSTTWKSYPLSWQKDLSRGYTRSINVLRSTEVSKSETKTVSQCVRSLPRTKRRILKLMSSNLIKSIKFSKKRQKNNQAQVLISCIVLSSPLNQALPPLYMMSHSLSLKTI